MKIIYKQKGETPLQCIERNFNDDVKRTYAGRLDPMAEGVLVVLEGRECKAEIKKKILDLDKTYEYEILIGVSTDSYDLLGLVNNVKNVQVVDIEKTLSELTGEISMKYPPYSSKTIDGTALFELSKMEKISNEDLPERKIKVFENRVLGKSIQTGEDISQYAIKMISFVKGDFRQDECIEKWKSFASEFKREKFVLFRIRTVCSSGTYIRSICNMIGEMNKVPTLAYSIKRLKVGEYSI